MKNLVYIASGRSKPEYEDLGYDKVYLVDVLKPKASSWRSDKIVALHMDALEAFGYFKENNIKIDCLVILCESRGEGGQSYSMCSDAFMGYYMPILSPDFIWICNDSCYYNDSGLYSYSSYKKGQQPQFKLHHVYYNEKYKKTLRIKMQDYYGHNFVSLDLPYVMVELEEGAPGYIAPRFFSSLLNDVNRGHVFKMHFAPVVESYPIGNITIRIIQDSIWNHFDELDALYISFRLDSYPKMFFFESLPKVEYYEHKDFGKKLNESFEKGCLHIGFTPHYLLQYDRAYRDQLVEFACSHIISGEKTITIDLYYLSSWFHTRNIHRAISIIQRKIHIYDRVRNSANCCQSH